MRRVVFAQGTVLHWTLYARKLHSIYTIVRFLQDVHSTWKATVHKQFQGKTMGHMAALLGRNRSAGVMQFSKKSTTVPIWILKHIDGHNLIWCRFHHPDPSKMSFATPKEGPLPKSLDWRDIDGGKYVTPVINQGGCGSCYAVSPSNYVSNRQSIANQITTVLAQVLQTPTHALEFCTRFQLQMSLPCAWESKLKAKTKQFLARNTSYPAPSWTRYFIPPLLSCWPS